MATVTDPLIAADKLSNKILARRPDIVKHVSYYRGRSGKLQFATPEFQQYHGARFRGLTDNWCQPVADSTSERINFLGMRMPEDTGLNEDVQTLWDANDASVGFDEAVTMVGVAGRAFALVSFPPEEGAPPRLTFEHPDSAAVLVDGQTGKRTWGMVMWEDDVFRYGQLQSPTTLWNVKQYIGVDEFMPDGVTRWDRGWVFDVIAAEIDPAAGVPNPMGEVSLVEVQNPALLDGDPLSDIEGVEAFQDAANLVWAYTLNALDGVSMPGRVVLNGEVPTEPILNADGDVIGEQPIDINALVHDKIAWFQGEGISIDQWSVATLGGFMDALKRIVEHVCAQTRTPAYYLLSSAEVPATGYELAEAGLVEKANARIERLRPWVREISRLLLIADGKSEQAKAIVRAKAVFRKPQYRSESQLMDGLTKMASIGFPFRWLAEEYGLSPAEVDRVMEMVEDERSDPYLSAMVAKEVASDGGGAEPSGVGGDVQPGSAQGD